MSNLMARLTAKYLLKRGLLITLNDGTQTRGGFRDSASKIQSTEVLNGFGDPSKTEGVVFTLDPAVKVTAGDVLLYDNTRYRVDRVIAHGEGDNEYTQSVVAVPA